ncbi:succinate--CoA ligase subunit alpha [Bosea sp. (in: a-proteobacteria)]|jgi:succinyl-CoA synthetase alpha subunit|uniref:Succinate--CoA ligase subunit alpha n=1 Tax=Bosea vestrisii TaxID=151416 RepID=A0ABW0H6Q4_9HYPH|nr:succinate--CoA ligase subunit alpha [Bosea sp. (in: a-proteobacteria)]MBA4219854.1 succinate--CoA ligase subunit alpha [Methylobacterium sp.]MBR3194639.1 succinate--CoA ligase subunit alpha [Bosea sp. (in: a-proteobacteria)]
MAVFLNRETRVLCQGMTGWAGTHHVARMMEYGTQVVGGVTPGKGGRSHLNLPVYERVAEARRETGANASIVFVPPANAAAAMIEAIEAEMPLVVAVTERIPTLDMVRVRSALKGGRTTLVGANSQGILVPGVGKLGVMATGSERPGGVGIISRSASLTSEVVAQVTAAGLGQSVTIGIGGDPIHGIGMRECLELLLDDADTEGVVLIGEIGGTEEEEVAAYLAGTPASKPVVALIVGREAPLERRMGHAGALTLRGKGDAAGKVKALQAAGVRIAPSAHLVGETIRQALAEGG